MTSSPHSSDEMNAADGLVSLSTDAYQDVNNAESDTSTDATTASSNWVDYLSTTNRRDGEISNDVTNSTSSSLETVENTSSFEAGWFMIILFIILKSINIYLV